MRQGVLTLILAAAATGWAAAGDWVEVDLALADLGEVHAFSITGLEKTRGYLGKDDGDAPKARLKRLLADFDHVIVQRPDGGIARVIVLGAKVQRSVQAAPLTGETPPASARGGEIVLHTTKRGGQNAVEVGLEGASGQRVSRSLLVDTGADVVVLPLSVAPSLGLHPGAMTRQTMQTANGKVEARLARLPALWLGGHRVADVDVAFLEDQRIGGNSLLGMSVLRRFRVTVDDAAGTITLGASE